MPKSSEQIGVGEMGRGEGKRRLQFDGRIDSRQPLGHILSRRLLLATIRHAEAVCASPSSSEFGTRASEEACLRALTKRILRHAEVLRGSLIDCSKVARSASRAPDCAGLAGKAT